MSIHYSCIYVSRFLYSSLFSSLFKRSYSLSSLFLFILISLSLSFLEVTLTSMMAILVASRGRRTRVPRSARVPRVSRFESQPGLLTSSGTTRTYQDLTSSPAETYQELVQVQCL